MARFGIVDLFAGIGGVADGFREQGAFDVIALVDNDSDARDTYLENHPDATYLHKDIRTLAGDDLRKTADGRSINGVVGCTPCQGQSEAGSRDVDHPMNGLADHYFRLVFELGPEFVVMENVPRILEDANFCRLVGELEGRGYRIWKGILNAALYGAPQTRQRAILIAFRRDLEVEPLPPEPTRFGDRAVFEYASQRLETPAGGRRDHVLGVCPATRRIHLKGLAEVPWLEYSQQDLERFRALPPLVHLGEALGDLPPAVALGEPAEVNAHVRWNHTPAMIERLGGVRPGGNLNDGRPAERYYSQAYARLHEHGLAFTLSTHFHNPGSGRFLHYRDLRCLSVREGARIQTLSDRDGEEDGFIFPKSMTASERLVGNAFPRCLAKALAQQIAVSLPN